MNVETASRCSEKSSYGQQRRRRSRSAQRMREAAVMRHVQARPRTDSAMI